MVDFKEDEEEDEGGFPDDEEDCDWYGVTGDYWDDDDDEGEGE